MFSLEREIAAIDQKFSNKELNSFGPGEDVVLQRFQEIRRRQVELSKRQIDMLSDKKKKGRYGPEQAGLEHLTEEMQKLCFMMEDVERLTLEETESKDKQEMHEHGREEGSGDRPPVLHVVGSSGSGPHDNLSPKDYSSRDEESF